MALRTVQSPRRGEERDCLHRVDNEEVIGVEEEPYTGDTEELELGVGEYVGRAGVLALVFLKTGARFLSARFWGVVSSLTRVGFPSRFRN